MASSMSAVRDMMRWGSQAPRRRAPKFVVRRKAGSLDAQLRACPCVLSASRASFDCFIRFPYPPTCLLVSACFTCPAARARPANSYLPDFATYRLHNGPRPQSASRRVLHFLGGLWQLRLLLPYHFRVRHSLLSSSCLPACLDCLPACLASASAGGSCTASAAASDDVITVCPPCSTLRPANRLR